MKNECVGKLEFADTFNAARRGRRALRIFCWWSNTAGDRKGRPYGFAGRCGIDPYGDLRAEQSPAPTIQKETFANRAIFHYLIGF